MNYILHIETSTDICSVSLSEDGQEILTKETGETKNHARILTIFIAEIMKVAGIVYEQLDAVAVSQGPGSYTGLRIGVSVAKGICYAKDKPLIAVDTLQALANGALLNVKKHPSFKDENTLLCPMIDARRMDVFDAFYSLDLVSARAVEFTRVEDNIYLNLLDKKKIAFFGNGAGKCKNTIKHKNAIFIDNIFCSAKNMIRSGYDAFNNKKFVDAAYFEPFYLKNFVATKSKKKFF